MAKLPIASYLVKMFVAKMLAAQLSTAKMIMVEVPRIGANRVKGEVKKLDQNHIAIM